MRTATSGERQPRSDVTIVDFYHLHRVELGAQLHKYPNDLTLEVCELFDELEANGRPLDYGKIYDDVQSGLLQVAADEAQAVKNEYAFHTRTSFLDDAGCLESPSRYLKRHGLPTNLRPQLRQVKDETTDSLRKEVVEQISSTALPYHLSSSVSAQEILEVIATQEKDLQDEVNGNISRVQETMPSPRSAEFAIAGVALMLSGVQGAYLNDPEKRRGIFEIEKSVRALITSLKKCASPETHIASRVIQELETLVRDDVRSTYSLHYISIINAAKKAAPSKLEHAYDLSTQQGSQYAKASDTPQNTGDENQKIKSVPKEASQSEQVSTKTRLLGDVEVDIPWTNSNTLTLHSLEDSQGQIIFGKALLPVAESISSILRQDQVHRIAFDRAWEQARRIELSHAAGIHPYISKVASRTDSLSDVLVLRYGNIAPNARRTYYVKTTVSKYPEITEQLAQVGISPNTPLLLLVGETDKGNQIELYKGFGFTRSQARAKNVGKI